MQNDGLCPFLIAYNVLAVAVSCKFEKQKYDNRKTVHRRTKNCRSI